MELRVTCIGEAEATNVNAVVRGSGCCMFWCSASRCEFVIHPLDTCPEYPTIQKVVSILSWQPFILHASLQAFGRTMWLP